MDLTIIIPSYNTKQDTKNCLNSIYKHTKGIEFEVIVVDNDSHDGSPQMIREEFPQVNLIANKENLGFGKANNQAAKQAKGEYILLLNSDTLLHDNALKTSLDAAKSIDKIGAFTCKLVYEDGDLQPTGGYFPTLCNLYAWQLFIDDLPLISKLIKSVHPPVSHYTQKRKLDWVTGAFTIIPTKVYKETGGFDPDIFMYAEELELCFRIRKHGYKVLYDPVATITHLQAKSSSVSYSLISEIKGIKYFFNKHKPAWQLPLAALAFKLGSLLRILVFGIIKNDSQKRDVYLKALSV